MPEQWSTYGIDKGITNSCILTVRILYIFINHIVTHWYLIRMGFMACCYVLYLLYLVIWRKYYPYDYFIILLKLFLFMCLKSDFRLLSSSSVGLYLSKCSFCIVPINWLIHSQCISIICKWCVESLLIHTEKFFSWPVIIIEVTSWTNLFTNCKRTNISMTTCLHLSSVISKQTPFF